MEFLSSFGDTFWVGVVSSVAVLAGVVVKGFFDGRGRYDRDLYKRLSNELNRVSARVTILEERRDYLESALLARDGYICTLKDHINRRLPPPPPDKDF